MDVNGFDVTAVTDGSAALAKLKAAYRPGRAPSGELDICVLDMQVRMGSFAPWMRGLLQLTRPSSHRCR